jgi:hypothetical protein
MAGRGGARSGAGRKPKRDTDPNAILEAEARIRSNLPKLIDNMLTVANGVTVQDMLLDGSTVIYTRAPDRQANEYLINRVMGKPTERKEVTGKGGGPVQLDVEDMTDDELDSIIEEEEGQSGT